MIAALFVIADNFGLYKLRYAMFKRVGLIKDGSDALNADIDEGLSNFWQAISGIQQKLWYANEVYNRKVNGV